MGDESVEAMSLIEGLEGTNSTFTRMHSAEGRWRSGGYYSFKCHRKREGNFPHFPFHLTDINRFHSLRGIYRGGGVSFVTMKDTLKTLKLSL